MSTTVAATAAAAAAVATDAAWTAAAAQCRWLRPRQAVRPAAMQRAEVRQTLKLTLVMLMLKQRLMAPVWEQLHKKRPGLAALSPVYWAGPA